MAITQYYVDYGAGNDTTGDGTVGTPWKTIQKALDTITRNSTDGDQINVKAGTAQVLAAALTLATYGTPSAIAPLILRGYTSAANDGGIGEIDCGGYTMWAAQYQVGLRDLEMHTFGNADGVDLGEYSVVEHCEFHKGASTPSAKHLLRTRGSGRILGCYFHDSGTNGRCIYSSSGRDYIAGNYMVVNEGLSAVFLEGNPNGSVIEHNHIIVSAAGSYGLYSNSAAGYVVKNNAIYNSAAGTGWGVNVNGSRYGAVIYNNIICGFSGVGGEAVDVAANGGLVAAGYNAFWNNTANYTLGEPLNYLDWTASDVSLAADPFTDAANGDFSLTDAAKTALRSLGWPSSYLGAHANTDAHITIGPLQYGPTPAAAGGGFPILGGSVVR